MLLQILLARSLCKPHYCWAIHGARAFLLGGHRSVSLRASRWGTARAFASSDTVFGCRKGRPLQVVPNSCQTHLDPAFFPECGAKGSRFTFGGRGLTRVRVTLLLASATVRNRPQPSVCGRRGRKVAVPMGKVAETWLFDVSEDVVMSFCAAGVALRGIPTCVTTRQKVVLCGRRNTFAPHSRLHTLRSTLHTSYSPLHNLCFTLHTPYSPLHTLSFTLHTLQSNFTLHTLFPHFTLHTPHLQLILLALTSVYIAWSAFGFVGFSCFLLLEDLKKVEGPTMPWGGSVLTPQCLDLAGWRCQGLEAFSVCLGKDHEGRDHDVGPCGHQGGKPESQRSCRHNNQGPGRVRCTLDQFVDCVVCAHEAFYTKLWDTLANFSCPHLVTKHHVAQMESNQVAATRGNSSDLWHLVAKWQTADDHQDTFSSSSWLGNRLVQRQVGHRTEGSSSTTGFTGANSLVECKMFDALGQIEDPSNFFRFASFDPSLRLFTCGVGPPFLLEPPCASLSLFEPLWASLSLFEPLWASLSLFEPLWASLSLFEPLWASLSLFEPLWASLSLFEPLWASWASLSLFEPLWASLSLFEPLWASLSLFEPLWASLSLFEPLWASLSLFEPLWASLSLFEPLWASLSLFEPLWASLSLFEPLWASLSLFEPLWASLSLFEPLWASLSLFEPLWASLSLFEPLRRPCLSPDLAVSDLTIPDPLWPSLTVSDHFLIPWPLFDSSFIVSDPLWPSLTLLRSRSCLTLFLHSLVQDTWTPNAQLIGAWVLAAKWAGPPARDSHRFLSWVRPSTACRHVKLVRRCVSGCHWQLISSDCSQI